MKQLISIAALLCAFSVLPNAATADVERSEVLRAINWVENPTNHARRGAHGELGPYQFRASTWRIHTRKSFNLATIRGHADEVAVKHYEWLKQGLQRAGIDPHPYNIALAWNSGLNSVVSGKVPDMTYNYAQRVTNLVESQRLRRQPAAAEPSPDSRSVASVPSFRLDGSTNPIQFTLGPTPPVFVLQSQPLYEPVVTTDKSVAQVQVAVVAAEAPAKPTFLLGGVAASGIAFVLP